MALTGFIAVFVGGPPNVTPSFGAPTLGPSDLAAGVMVFAGCFALLLIIVGAVWYINLLMKYRKAFVEAALLARTSEQAG